LAQYVQVQQRRAIAAEKAIELRDRQQSFKEREQQLKEIKYEDKIFKMNIAKIRSGKPNSSETRTEQPKPISELTSEMRPTDFNLNTQSNPTHNRTKPKIEHEPK